MSINEGCVSNDHAQNGQNKSFGQFMNDLNSTVQNEDLLYREPIGYSALNNGKTFWNNQNIPSQNMNPEFSHMNNKDNINRMGMNNNVNTPGNMTYNMQNAQTAPQYVNIPGQMQNAQTAPQHVNIPGQMQNAQTAPQCVNTPEQMQNAQTVPQYVNTTGSMQNNIQNENQQRTVCFDVKNNSVKVQRASYLPLNNMKNFMNNGTQYTSQASEETNGPVFKTFEPEYLNSEEYDYQTKNIHMQNDVLSESNKETISDTVCDNIAETKTVISTQADKPMPYVNIPTKKIEPAKQEVVEENLPKKKDNSAIFGVLGLFIFVVMFGIIGFTVLNYEIIIDWINQINL